jgi:hypothetical protein
MLEDVVVETGYGDEGAAGAVQLAVDVGLELRKVAEVRLSAAPLRLDKVGETTEVERAVDLLMLGIRAACR